MFNGIIKKTGRLKQIYRGDKSYFIEIVSDVKFSKNEDGMSKAGKSTFVFKE